MEKHLRKNSILIVDDSEFHCKYLQSILMDEYDVMIAKNGRNAISIANSENQPDVILLDIVMPDIDGYKVCQILKSSKFTSEIPIIFITGKMDEQDEIYAFELGAVDYVSKPFNPIIVKSRLRTHVKLKQYKDYLESMSYIDGLTQISNRRKFDVFFDMMWNLSLREEKPLSIIMIDIDYFKLFNDRYGHQSGDDCLIKVAKQLASTIHRKTDFVGRYGGEEFVSILRDTTLENAYALAEKMRKRILELQIPHVNSKVSDIVTISLGVSGCVPRKGWIQTDLIECADQALYRAKESGRNRAYSEEFLPKDII